MSGRVVHVVSSLDPSLGGPPVAALRLAAAQQELGWDAELVSYLALEQQARVDEGLAGAPHVGAVRRHNLRPGGGLDRLRAKVARRFLSEHLAGASWVHLHGFWEPIVLAGAEVATALGVPWSVAPHGMLAPWSLGRKSLKKRLALALGYRRLVTDATFVHALSPGEREEIRAAGATAPIEVIPNGVFLDELDPMPAAGSFRADHPELGDDPFILFLGRLFPGKGVGRLAEAFVRVARDRDDVRLVLVGPDGGALSELEAVLRGSELESRVHVLGPIWGRAKYAAMVDAAVFCLPSEQEAFSMAITEALATGTPVVITESCKFPDVAAFGAGREVSLDPAQVAEALLEILGDEALAREMGEAARGLVEARYTWPEIARASLELYERYGRGRMSG